MNDHDKVQNVADHITKEDIARVIHQLTYRKAYNQSAKAIERRKERQERMKRVREYIKQHPEVVA